MKTDKNTPFKWKFLDSIWRWQDNIVVEYLNEYKWKINNVIKWNHESKNTKTTSQLLNEQKYVKKKYEMLKFFLWDFIPETHFLLWNKIDWKKQRNKKYIIQKKVPNMRISMLSDEQRNDKRLITNINKLIYKLKNLYKTIDEVNESVDEEWKIDCRLDIKWLSKKSFENKNLLNVSTNQHDIFNSPNLLVDPVTMDLFCIDFWRWDWNEKKEATITTLLVLAKNNQKIIDTIKS